MELVYQADSSLRYIATDQDSIVFSTESSLYYSKSIINPSDIDRRRIDVCAGGGFQLGFGYISLYHASCGSGSTRTSNPWIRYASVAAKRVNWPVDLGAKRYQLVAMNKKGNRLATFDSRGFVQLYQIKNNSPQLEYQNQIQGLMANRINKLRPIAFSPDLQWVVLQDWHDYYIQIHNTRDPKQMHRSEYYQSPINPFQQHFTFSADGRYYFDGRRIRRSSNGKIKRKFSAIPNQLLRQSSFSPDGRYLALLTHRFDARAKILQSKRPYHYYKDSRVSIYPTTLDQLESRGINRKKAKQNTEPLREYVWQSRVQSIAWGSDRLFAGDLKGQLWQISSRTLNLDM